MNDTVRPTKKQREILTYIEQFIGQHGYSPSYREIMNGLNYTSVATVSLHVNSLIRRGHLRKRDRSARSLEVVAVTDTATGSAAPEAVRPAEEKWLVDRVETLFARIEQAGADVKESMYEEIEVVISALRVLGLEAVASSLAPRLAEVRVQVEPADDQPPAEPPVKSENPQGE